MKSIQFKKIALAALIATASFSCSDDNDGNTPENTLLVEAQNQTSLSTFVQALERAGLDASMNGDANFTVFAPTNSAFDQYLGENGFATVDEVPVDDLRNLLMYHTLSGSIETSELFTGYRKTLAKGDASDTNYLDMYFDTSAATKMNGTAMISTGNIEAKNGYLHIIDKVLAIPTVMTFITANSELQTMETALGFNTTAAIDATLGGSVGSPFTIFAPTNSAFSAFLTETGQTGFAGFPEAHLQSTLLYHVGSGINALSSNFTNNQVFSTLAGQDFTITLTGGGKKITDANSRVSTMTQTDIQANNGVIHVIDKVLLPTL